MNNLSSMDAPFILQGATRTLDSHHGPHGHARKNNWRRMTLVSTILAISVVASVSNASAPTLTPRGTMHASSVEDLEKITSWASPLDPNRFNPYTGSLLAPLMIPRVSGTANNTLVQQFILDHFAALNQTSPGDGSAPVDDSGDNSQKKKRSKHGWHVEQDRFEEMTPYGMKTFTNLIFTKNPKATNRLVFAAHFDSKYFPPPNAPFSPNGALDRMGQRLRGNGGDDTLPFTAGTDSAVPCAILLDLAASLDQALEDQMWANTNRAAQAGWEEDEETTLQFVFFDGEEAFVDWTATDSLYGSRHLAELWAKRTVPKVRLATGRNGGSTSNNLEGIELFVLLDLLGVENPRIPSYFGTTQWAHRHILSIEERLWQSKLHGTQLLANKQRRALLQAQNVEERAGEEEEDEMDRLEEEAIEIETPLHAYLTEDAAYGGVDDDHRPFLHKGVPILHIIPTPFPHVWHTLQDDAKAIKPEVVEGWTNIFRVFTAEYLQLLHPRTRQNPRHDEL
ncbi:glutaminyl-peptide cyclotransferase [Entomortierella parvispora]|uniref:Peptide hydrolase n=1 Tax=Entomortierella parvispora TaxID=205924 RepID=A0A9P3LTX7_9FUNG|nr:glutaminyl-peptide cyclotransferase [Entomortierella parvispora]